MKAENKSSMIIGKLMFRLLPIQVLLALIGSINSIVSSLFAANVIGKEAMNATGLYGPVAMLLGAISTMLVGGSLILCGKYMGKNLVEDMQNVFSLDLLFSILVGALFTGITILISTFNLSGFLARDPITCPIFNRYMLGQAIGMIPTVLTTQLSAFLSLENQNRRTTVASIICIGVNALLNYLFVVVLRMDVFGLSLASSLSMWVFFLIEAQFFFTKKSSLRFLLQKAQWSNTREVIRIGLPGAIGYGYQTLRGIVVNNLLTVAVGSIAVSAFATANTLLGFFWAIPAGMLNVSRMLFSVSIGEEDRQSLVDTMRYMFRRYIPVMCIIVAAIVAAAVPLTRLYYRDPADPVFDMTVWGFRILPLCMPLSIICMHFTCFGQVSNKQALVHVLAALDGVVCVAGFSFLLVGSLKVNGVYIANVLNGIVTTLVVIGYAWIKNKKVPRNTEELMVIPPDFGVGEDDRISLSLHSMEEVIRISQKIQNFCLEKGIDNRRAYLAGLCMEEMAGNVVAYGFPKDRKKHSVDIRVIYKDNGLILRIKDDCIRFNPTERREVFDPEDITKNIGIRMVCDIAENVEYQSIFGLNVLTITI